LPSQDVLASYSLNKENGTYINNPVSTTGKVNGATSFNGSDNYVEIPHDPNLNFGEGDFSMSAWIKTSDSDAYIFNKEYKKYKVDNVQGYALYLFNGDLSLRLADGNGSWKCSTSASASCTNYDSGKSIPADGGWHLVAVTVDRDDPSGGKFYIDGIEVNTFNPTFRSGSLDTEKPLKLGSNSSSTSGMLNGELDEVTLYQRALTKEDIYRLYENDSNGICKVVKSEPPSQPVLSVTPTSKDIPATSGTFTFDVANTGNGTMNWTATSDSWLTINSASGTNDGTITVNYTANSGDAKTGTITVTADGAENSPQTVEVKQEGIIATTAKPIALYATNAKNIRVVPLVQGSIPNLNEGVDLIASAPCEDDMTQPVNIVSLNNSGDFLTIWWNNNTDKACYSRFTSDNNGSFTEKYMGDWLGGATSVWSAGTNGDIGNIWLPLPAADLNADKIDDLVIIRWHRLGTGSKSVEYKVALGQSDGSFDFNSVATTFITGAWTGSATLADADGDNHADLIYYYFSHGGSHSTDIYSLKGQGDGTFVPVADKKLLVSTGASRGSNLAAIGDFSSDQYPDLFLPPDDDV
jgi:hypothetical protein